MPLPYKKAEAELADRKKEIEYWQVLVKQMDEDHDKTKAELASLKEKRVDVLWLDQKIDTLKAERDRLEERLEQAEADAELAGRELQVQIDECAKLRGWLNSHLQKGPYDRKLEAERDRLKKALEKIKLFCNRNTLCDVQVRMWVEEALAGWQGERETPRKSKTRVGWWIEDEELEKRDVEELAAKMHDWYERAANETGWATQNSCQVAWEDLPEANKKTMLVVARRVKELLCGGSSVQEPCCEKED